jgi:RelA/SpoT family (p)ppGpp synthetase
MCPPPANDPAATADVPPAAPAALADPVALQRLLAVTARHLPETDGAEQLLRGTLAWLTPGAAGVRPPAASALELGFAAAEALADLRLDPATLAATLVVAAAPPVSIAAPELSQALGAEVAALADGACRLRQVRWDRLEEERAETLRKMFLAMARDVRVVLIVLALRLEELLRASGAEAQRLAAETLEVHAPLANRLGVWQFKWQLEDGAFRILEPEAYAELARALAETRTHREQYVASCIAALQAKLAEAGLTAEVSGRPKHVYSIHRKMQKKLISFEQIHDLSALRVITEQVQDCYAVLGLVHSLWTPVPHEVDDYIAMPKDNGYQSLHTALIGPEGRVVEVQIRTREMHRFAEFGVAAHWAYKEGKRANAAGRDRFMLLRQLLDWEREVVDPHQLVLETDIFADRVFVFTPRGDVIDMTLGSTPVDFAYRIHTEVGHRCRGARVNDQIVPLDYQLRTGDRVEILTHKLARPSRDWMNPSLGYLKTADARAKVRHWFREQGRPEAIHAGRELVIKELGRLDLSRISLEQLAEELGHENAEELFAAVGYGDRRSSSVTSAALQIEKRLAGAEGPPSEPELPPQPAPRPAAPTRGITIDQVEDIQGQRARCCNPVPGDDVLGFVTRGRGLMIHRRNCPQLKNLREPERMVEVQWGSLGNDRHSVEIEVIITDRAGVLGDLLKLVANQGAYISRVEAQSTRRGDTSLRLSLDCRDAGHVAQVLERVAHHSEVVALRRVFDGRA